MNIFHADGDQWVIYCGPRTVPVNVIGTDGDPVEVDGGNDERVLEAAEATPAKSAGSDAD